MILLLPNQVDQNTRNEAVVVKESDVPDSIDVTRLKDDVTRLKEDVNQLEENVTELKKNAVMKDVLAQAMSSASQSGTDR